LSYVCIWYKCIFIARLILTWFTIYDLWFAIPILFKQSWNSHCLLHFSDITRGSYIRYYEAAIYDTAALRRHRNRIRRDVTYSEQPLILHLKTLDRWVVNPVNQFIRSLLSSLLCSTLHCKSSSCLRLQ